MADIELRRVHNLGLEQARAVADEVAEKLGRKFGLKGDWDGNVLRFERPGVTGSLAVSDKDLSLSVALGLLLKAMKGSIREAAERELDELVEAAKSAASAKPAKKAAASLKKAR
ncbi:MAG TPA: polyhydroxyalkanoic acid system family protein [Usitatibacter sp.]|nr:polyhydroxyalkanoic acid system family protein [Usitatibacter sp.]